MRKKITADPQDRWGLSSPADLTPFSLREIGKGRSTYDLWEDWEHALPFTAGENFLNVGLTHEVAFAADHFGGIRRLPRNFHGYEELARRVEHKYVRGWIAKDGERMFLWDDLNEVLASPVGHFVYFEDAILKLGRRGRARPSTELWDRGGERYIGTLGGLNLLES
jgi:hypothetical protein